MVVAGANVHDTKLLALTLGSVLVERPDGRVGPQHLCLDKGYDNPTGHQAAAAHGYRGHIRRIGEEKLDARGVKRYPAGRWSAPWLGYPSAGRSWCAMTRRHATTWVWRNWPAPCSGSAANGN